MHDTIELVSTDRCYGCRACAETCPKQCIEMRENAEGFFYPHLDADACIRCGKCAAVCPALHPAAHPYAPRAFAVVNQNDAVRRSASSGGVFFALAQAILRQGGVVFGVQFDERFSARYAAAQTEEEARTFCRSKYLQSDINICLPEAKAYLEKNLPVLFTGTACHVAGLKQFLGKEYDNLYTVDLICSGVSSPALWKKYLHSFRQGLPRDVSFRDKSSGWSKFSVRIEFEKQTYLRPHREDPYMQMFLDGFTLRECCYHCGFRKQNIAADLTIADFWGIDKVMPELNDDQGISLVLAHSDKGNTLLHACETLSLSAADAEQALKNNPFVEKSHLRQDRRDKYLHALPRRNFAYLYNKCYHSTNIEKLKTQIAKRIGYNP